MPLDETHPEPEPPPPLDCLPKGINSPRTLFRVITSAPLRKHMAILNKHETFPTVIRLMDSDSALLTSSPTNILPLSPACLNDSAKVMPVPGFENKTDTEKMDALETFTPLQENAMAKAVESPRITDYSPPKSSFEPTENVSDATSDTRESQDSSAITPRSTLTPLVEPAIISPTVPVTTYPIDIAEKSKDVVIIDLDDDEDDGADCRNEAYSAESVLGKRKTGSQAATSDVRDVRLGLDATRAPQTLVGNRSNSNNNSAAGSQQCPVELDSDSEDDKPPSQRQRLTSANGCAGSTIDQPILISTEDCLEADDLNPQSTSDRNSGGISWDKSATPSSLIPLPRLADETNSIQQQLKAYQSLQKNRFERQIARKNYSSADLGGTGSGATKAHDYGNSDGTPISRPTVGHEQVVIPSIQNTLHPPQDGERVDSVSSEGSNHETLLPFEILLEGTQPTEATEDESGVAESMSSSQRIDSNHREDDPNKTKDGLDLSEDQLYVVDQVVNRRKNVFFTGSAGTGKSVLLRELIVRLKARRGRWPESDDWDSLAVGRVAVTASTGIAACNIGGCTLHSFAGIGLGQDSFPKLAAKVKNSRQTVRRWKHIDVLIVDEVSMIDAELLDKLEHLARHIREDNQPWGGIQVILCGDFFQLPPVDKTGKAKFCFEAECWPTTIHATIQLGRIFRQKDLSFADMLNQMRIGRMNSTTIRCFSNLTRNIQQDDGLKPTELFPLRTQVDGANIEMLRKLTGESLIFEAEDSGKLKEKMEQQCIAPTKLEIKVGAQVMLLRNQSGGSSGLVNGSIGKVIAFVNEPASNFRTGPNGEPLPSLNTPGELLPKVRFVNDQGTTRDMVVGREEWTLEMPDGEFLAGRIQIPLCLAWALSIHKSQGQTLPKVRVDLGRVFEKGQAYVALSRATTLEGLQVLNFNPSKVMVHPKVVEFYDQLERRKESVNAH